MIPTIRPERILSRCVFELNFGSGQSFSQQVYFDVCQEITRLLPPLLTTHIHLNNTNNSNNESTEKLKQQLFNLYVLLPQSPATMNALNLSPLTYLVEIKDTRISAFLCDILQERRVIRLSSGNGNCQLSWCLGVEGNNDYPLYNLPESHERSEDELRMNIDEELWAQTNDRREDVVKWLNLYAPLTNQQQDQPQTPETVFSLQRLEAAFTKATSAMFSMASNAQQILDQDPFQNGFFLGAFDKQGNPTLIASLLPILSNETKPTAKALSSAIVKAKNVYFRSLCLLYLRYRCSPENIAIFFGPSFSSSTNTNINAPSFFSPLGKVYDDSNIIPDNNNILCPLLDTSLIQTSFDGSSTTTMKEFSRSLLTEDELVEFWLPTYSKFAVEKLTSTVINKIDQYQQERIHFLRQKRQEEAQAQQQNQNQTSSSMIPQRRGRNNQQQQEAAPKPQNSANNKDPSASSLLLPSGIKSMSQFAALMQERARQQQEQDELKRREQEEKERKLREQFAGTAEEQLQRREIFQREAAALKDRRRREVLDRLKSTADAKDKSNALQAMKSGGSHHQMSAVDAKTAELIAAMTSSSSNNFSSSNHPEVVDGNLLNRSVVYFAANPPPFAALPPFVGNNNGSSASALATLCSTSTVGTEDMFVCF